MEAAGSASLRLAEADAVARYRTASEQADIDALVETLAQDAELVSPLSRRMVFRGREDLRALLDAVYTSVRRLRWDGRPAARAYAWCSARAPWRD